VSTYQWAITIGMLLAGIINNATKDYNGVNSYRIPIAVQFIWAGVLAIGMAMLPESPRWLVKRGRIEDATRALGRITGLPSSDTIVQAEVEEIRMNLDVEQSMGSNSYADCFKSQNKIAFRTLTGIFIQAMQQLSGSKS
jgi:MFS transporter, SP family, sugar:H+ symporter